MIQEGKYTFSELMEALKESNTKNEFKPKLGDGVEKGNKKNNKEAVDDIAKRTSKYNGDKMAHTVILPNDRNKTTIDLKFNELKPGKDWYERVEAQAEGYPSVENKKTSDTKDNGGLDYKGNETFYKHREKLQKDWKGTVKDDMDAGLKGRELKKYNVVNENLGFDFDVEDDNLITPNIVAKDFIKWVGSESSTNNDIMQLINDACENNDQDAVEELSTMYFESRYDDMAQWNTIMAGIEKALAAYGYTKTEDSNTPSENNVDNESDENDDEPESLDESKKREGQKKTIQRIHFKKTVFLNEGQMLRQIPEDFKTDNNKFLVKDASGTEYMVECKIDKQFNHPILSIISCLNENKTSEELSKMKHLFGYERDKNTNVRETANDVVFNLHEQIEKVRELSETNEN